MLARIETADGVEAAWIDGEGKRIAVRARKGVDIAAVLKSSGLGIEREPGDFKIPGVGWYRAKETIAFSEREAKVLGERYAAKSREAAGLSEEQMRKLSAVIEKRFLERFREFHDGKGSIDNTWLKRDLILQDAAEFLTPAQIDSVRRAFDQ